MLRPMRTSERSSVTFRHVFRTSSRGEDVLYGGNRQTHSTLHNKSRASGKAEVAIPAGK